MTILLGIHSWLSRIEYKSMDRGLMSAFSGLLDLGVTTGIIFFIWDGFSGAGFPSYRLLAVLTRGLSR